MQLSQLAAPAKARLRSVPLFVHDCDRCTRLATYTLFSDGKQYDLYICNGSLIARFGNDGPDYISMPVSIYHQIGGNADEAIVRAYEIASLRNLITTNDEPIIMTAEEWNVVKDDFTFAPSNW